MDEKTQKLHQACIEEMKSSSFMLTIMQLLPLIKEKGPENWEHNRKQLIRWLWNDLQPVGEELEDGN
ncbi:hypothetical protein KAR91_68340 [Candidatus Pacearchaeota archaeon]|nr:hypothetical protein [Candidatus Pacearchaeota archaeon]